MQEQVTLKALLAQRDKDWTELAKITLAILLTYSLFHFYGGSWAKDRWSRTNIVFFKHGMNIPLRPFLSFDPQKERGPLRDPGGIHRYPEFLELGVILLEINLGQKLGSYRGLKEDDISNYNDLWCEAWEVFQKRRLHFTSAAYRHAVEKCLKPDFWISDVCDDQKLRDSLFNEIVKPLELELSRAFKDEISLEFLDEDAETMIDLGSAWHPAGGEGTTLAGVLSVPWPNQPQTMQYFDEDYQLKRGKSLPER